MVANMGKKGGFKRRSKEMLKSIILKLRGRRSRRHNSRNLRHA